MPQPRNGFPSYQKYAFYFLFTIKFPFLADSTWPVFHFIWECVSWISVFMPLQLSICHMKVVFDNFSIENLSATFNVAFPSIWLMSGFMILLNFKLQSTRITEIIDEIDENFMWRSAKGKTYITAEKSYKFARFMSIFWQVGPISSVVYSLVRPLFEKPVKLPSVDWYFFDVHKSYRFALAYILQSWPQLNAVASIAVGTTLFHTCCVLCCGQFNILKCSLKNIVFSSGVYKRFLGMLDSSSVVANADEYFYDEELDDDDIAFPVPSKGVQNCTVNLTPAEVIDLRNSLTNCVKQHVKLRRICTLVESCMSFVMLLRLVELTIEICVLAFALNKTPNVLTLSYVAFAAFDLFLLTYPADRVMFQNKSISASLMMGPWYLVSKYMRNEFLIIIAFSHRPIRFTIGKILVLNADKLRGVLQMAFSYYTLLSAIDKQYSSGQ